MRASSVLNRQSTGFVSALRWFCQAAISRIIGSIPTKARNPPRDFATSGCFRNVLRVAA